MLSGVARLPRQENLILFGNFLDFDPASLLRQAALHVGEGPRALGHASLYLLLPLGEFPPTNEPTTVIIPKSSLTPVIQHSRSCLQRHTQKVMGSGIATGWGVVLPRDGEWYCHGMGSGIATGWGVVLPWDGE
jgi:hypothetical protein